MNGLPVVKPVEFLGDSLARLREFPEEPRAEAGHQIFTVQCGEDPTDWKPMKTVGPGVREIRIRDVAGAFRVVYVAAFPDAVYVLHAFQKKTQRAGKPDIDLAGSRYRQLLKGAV